VETRLYALKCDQGYIRYSEEVCEQVGLNKASVYVKPDDPGLLDALSAAGRNGTSNNRIVELILEEIDYYGKKDY
jgi:hypothetical protein